MWLNLRSAGDFQDPGQAHFREQRLEKVDAAVLIRRLKTLMAGVKHSPPCREDSDAAAKIWKVQQAARGAWKLMSFVIRKITKIENYTSI